MDVRAGPLKWLNTEELMFSNCDSGEDSWGSLGQKIKSVNPKGNQPWIFTGKTHAEAEAPIIWPPDEKSRLIGKDTDAGKDRRQKEKRVAEREMVGWHHRLNGREFEQTPGDSEGQGSLVCCSPCGIKQSDTTYWLNDSIEEHSNILRMTDLKEKRSQIPCGFVELACMR